MRTGILAALIVAGALAALDAQGGKPLSNEAVVNLVKGGMTERVVIAAVAAAPAVEFDVSPEALMALKNAKVPETVIEAMLLKMAAATAPAAPPASAAAATTGAAFDDSVAFLRGLAPGIYMTRRTDSATDLIALEPTVFSRVKTKGVWASRFSFGAADIEMIAELRGDEATIRTAAETPVFYFLFERSSPGSGTAATSPNEFALVQLYEERGRRELTVASGNIGGATAGLDPENVVPVAVERLGQTFAYRVTPKDTLGRGEFCWIYTPGISGMQPGGGAAVKIFDFGVDPGRTR